MLSGTNKYYHITKRANWFVSLFLVLILVNVFSPFITLMKFRMHIDEHLVECQQLRHHDKDCQASCILAEIISEHTKAIPEKAISFVYFFPDLFFLNHQLTPTAFLKAIWIVNLFSHYLLLYSPPILRMHSPPPKMY